ncbi:DUF6461 domain-containing protein [Acrocarpospora corrugata]|uniref:DUF6461 domain-containing protein n=1 Tax=Acrocarpospora corrugata TaxID=35763 RepID=UPI0012D34BC0|nr:DUF6461 domain-containing protein [Acrocarpospora corrugata]
MAAGLPSQFCLTWCRENDLDLVAGRFGADVETGLRATEDDIEELEEDDSVEMLYLISVGDWTLALEPGGYQGSRSVVLESVSAGGLALSVFWNGELDNAIGFAVDGELATSFDITDLKRRSGADPDVLDEALAELGLRDGLSLDEIKARALALGEQVSGHALTPESLRASRQAYQISDPLPSPLVPADYLNPREPFLDEPAFVRLIADPSPAAAPELLRELVATVITIADLRGPLPEDVLRLLDHGERFPGERGTLRSQLWQEAGEARQLSAGSPALDLTSHALVVLYRALLPAPVEAADAATREAVRLRTATREDGMRLIVLNRISEHMERAHRRQKPHGL